MLKYSIKTKRIIVYSCCLLPILDQSLNLRAMFCIQVKVLLEAKLKLMVPTDNCVIVPLGFFPFVMSRLG